VKRSKQGYDVNRCWSGLKLTTGTLPVTQVQRLELAPTLLPLPQESASDTEEAEAEPMPQRPLVLAGFPLDPGAGSDRCNGVCRQRGHDNVAGSAPSFIAGCFIT